MPSTKERHNYKRSFEDKITENLSLSHLKPVDNIRRDLKPQLIALFIKKYGENLVGEIIEAKSSSYYVVRKVTKEGLEATPLGVYQTGRPHIITLPNDASGIVADKKKITSRYRQGYRNILLEIKEEGENVEIPPENNGQFDIF